MKTLIIAGGRKSQCQHTTGQLPTSLVPVAGKPILHYQLEMLARQGFHEIIICIDESGEAIRSLVGNGSAFGVQVTYQKCTASSTAVDCINASKQLLQDDFLVIQGGVFAYMELRRLVTFHQTKKADVTLVAQAKENPHDYDLLDCDSTNRVIPFYPQPQNSPLYYRNLADTHIYLFSPSIFNFLNNIHERDMARDVLPHLAKQASVFAYNTSEYIAEIYAPTQPDALYEDIVSGKVARKSYFHTQKAIFLDRDGVLNEDTDFITKPEEFHLFPFTAQAVKQINQSEYTAVVVTNQSAIARNLCTEEGLREIHNKMDTELAHSQAKIDAVYYCPHHPDEGGHYKIDCDCRKPKPGMLLQAAQEFHISLPDSYMIGDTDRDKEAGKRAGCITIGVRTGKGCVDLKSDPDFLFENVAEAVDFIVTEPLKPQFESLCDLFHQYPAEDRPFVIVIGGQARSGKSTLASYLRLQFQKQGLRVLSIRADDWIMPAQDRTGNETVWERFRLDTFEKDMHHLFSHEPISVQKYDSKSRALKEEVIYRYTNEDIVLMEGAPLLHCQSLLNLSDVSIFVRVNEPKRRERFEAFYRWKGIAQHEIENLYEERLINEYIEIEQTSAAADVIIKN